MLSREQKRNYRSEIFRHLDGIATAPTAFTLYENGVLRLLLEKQRIEVRELAELTKANAGYLNVALRILASQGWLDQHLDDDEVLYGTNQLSSLAFSMVPAYREAVELLRFSGQFHPRLFELEPFRKLEALFQSFKSNCGLKVEANGKEGEIAAQMLKHIEGTMVGPSVVHLAMGGMFHQYFMGAGFRADEFHKDPESFGSLLDMFVHLDWFSKKADIYRFTERGLFFARRASAYGVTVSYMPTFRKLDELIFGDAEILWKSEAHGEEAHVDREMNVWGSGGAHSAYFKVVDEVLIDIFDRPIEEQPKGVLDMGCGNGAFIEHIYNVVEQRTLRGKMLEDHPLLLVGADFNEAALRVTRANLSKADIWAKVVQGDISKPDQLSRDLRSDYGIELSELLNVRTFLDHNRPWDPPNELKGPSRSTGAFAYRGTLLTNTAVEASLKEHFKRWAPFVDRFGLLVIELHALPPALTAANIGSTPATAYEATHGYSDQFIIEADLYRDLVAQAGLVSQERYARKFPNGELATVTIDLFTKP